MQLKLLAPHPSPPPLPPAVNVAGIYVWSVGSFDVFGVHPISTSSQGSFADPAIIGMAKKQNGMA